MLNEVYDLFIDLDATEDQIEFPGALHERARGACDDGPGDPGKTCSRCSTPSSSHVPPPRGNPDAPLQMLVANLDSSDYLGRIAIGRMFNGTVKLNGPVSVLKLGGTIE